MKNLIFTILLSVSTLGVFAQCNGTAGQAKPATSIGIVIYSNDAETVFNALRFANFSKEPGDTVNIFLLGKGVELDFLVKSDNNVKEQANTFLQSGGNIMGCGTCLQNRNIGSPQVCKFSSMSDLYDMVRKNKIVLTF